MCEMTYISYLFGAKGWSKTKCKAHGLGPLVILLHVAGCQLFSQLLYLHLRRAAFQEDIPPDDLRGNRVISHQAHRAQVGVLGGIFGLRHRNFTVYFQ